MGGTFGDLLYGFLAIAGVSMKFIVQDCRSCATT